LLDLLSPALIHKNFYKSAFLYFYNEYQVTNWSYDWKKVYLKVFKEELNFLCFLRITMNFFIKNHIQEQNLSYFSLRTYSHKNLIEMRLYYLLPLI